MTGGRDNRSRAWSRTRMRGALTVALAVVATVALMVAGQDGAVALARVTAVVVAVAAGTTSLVTARRKGDLVGWYVIAVALLVVRLLRG